MDRENDRYLPLHDLDGAEDPDQRRRHHRRSRGDVASRRRSRGVRLRTPPTSNRCFELFATSDERVIMTLPTKKNSPGVDPFTARLLIRLGSLTNSDGLMDVGQDAVYLLPAWTGRKLRSPGLEVAPLEYRSFMDVRAQAMVEFTSPTTRPHPVRPKTTGSNRSSPCGLVRHASRSDFQVYVGLRI